MSSKLEFFACGEILCSDIDRIVISVRDDSSSESEEPEDDQFTIFLQLMC